MEACRLGASALRCPHARWKQMRWDFSCTWRKEGSTMIVDVQSRPSSARVLCDLRPVTPSLGLGTREIKPDGLCRPQSLTPMGLSAFVLGSLPTFSLSPAFPWLLGTGKCGRAKEGALLQR